ncbi:MAG: DUF1702 family protein [Brevibacillus sp.]|nr:DUF1702 family protein [Brevibacillus sp.]
MSGRHKRFLSELLLRLLRRNPARYERQLLQADGRSFYQERFRHVLHAFFTGYNTGLRAELCPDEIRASLDGRFAPFYRGFAYEGLGMGLAARGEIITSGKFTFERDIRMIDPGYIYQYYVGLGWWLHTCYGCRPRCYRPRVSRLHPHYALIVYDGVGFKTGLFHGADPDLAISRFSRFSPDEQRVCWQGYGRSIWFVNQFDIERAVAAANRLPLHVLADVYSGVGLAVAYSTFDYPDWAVNVRSLLPSPLQPAFDQGLAFGWETRRLQNHPYYREVIAGYPDGLAERVEHMVSAVHTASRRVSAITVSELFYSRWIEETRRLLANREE